jgi:hypothetical protein
VNFWEFLDRNPNVALLLAIFVPSALAVAALAAFGSP